MNHRHPTGSHWCEEVTAATGAKRLCVKFYKFSRALPMVSADICCAICGVSLTANTKQLVIFRPKANDRPTRHSLHISLHTASHDRRPESSVSSSYALHASLIKSPWGWMPITTHGCRSREESHVNKWLLMRTRAKRCAAQRLDSRYRWASVTSCNASRPVMQELPKGANAEAIGTPSPPLPGRWPHRCNGWMRG